MDERHEERLRNLCAQAAEAQSSEELMTLVNQMMEILDQKKQPRDPRGSLPDR